MQECVGLWGHSLSHSRRLSQCDRTSLQPKLTAYKGVQQQGFNIAAVPMDPTGTPTVIDFDAAVAIRLIFAYGPALLISLAVAFAGLHSAGWSLVRVPPAPTLTLYLSSRA